MKKHLKNPHSYLSLSLLSAISAAALHTIAYATAYGEQGANYFSATSLLPRLSGAFAILACLFACVSFFFQKSTPLSVSASANRLTSIPAAIGFLVGGTLFFLSNTTKLTYSISAFCILAAIYLASHAFSLIEDPFVLALIGFSAVIACILCNGYFYFDRSLELNAPLKINTMIGMLTAMLYFIGELRILIGRAMPRTYCVITACTIGLSALSALPIPVAFLLGKFDRVATPKAPTAMTAIFEHPEYFAGAVVILGVSITAALKLLEVLTCKEEA